MQQKDMKRRAYAASLSLLGGKRSKLPQLGQQMPTFGDFCQEQRVDNYEGGILQTKATKRGRKQDLLADAESNAATAKLLKKRDASVAPKHDCSPVRSQSNAAKQISMTSLSGRQQCIPKKSEKALKRQEESQAVRQRKATGKQDQVKIKEGKQVVKRTAKQARPPPEAEAEILQPVSQQSPSKISPGSLTPIQIEEQQEQAVIPNAKLASGDSAQAKKADALKDLVRRLEGRADKVALDLRLEHASRKMREGKAQASLNGNKKSGEALPQNPQNLEDKPDTTSLPVEASVPDKRLSDKPTPPNGNSADLADKVRKPADLRPMDRSGARLGVERGSILQASSAFECEGAQLLSNLSPKAVDATSRAANHRSKGKRSQARASDFPNDDPSLNGALHKRQSDSPDWSPQISDMPHSFGKQVTWPSSNPSSMQIAYSSVRNLPQDRQNYCSPSSERYAKVIAITCVAKLPLQRTLCLMHLSVKIYCCAFYWMTKV